MVLTGFRFVDESSAATALTFREGVLEESNVPVAIWSVFRSKWILEFPHMKGRTYQRQDSWGQPQTQQAQHAQQTQQPQQHQDANNAVPNSVPPQTSFAPSHMGMPQFPVSVGHQYGHFAMFPPGGYNYMPFDPRAFNHQGYPQTQQPGFVNTSPQFRFAGPAPLMPGQFMMPAAAGGMVPPGHEEWMRGQNMGQPLTARKLYVPGKPKEQQPSTQSKPPSEVTIDAAKETYATYGHKSSRSIAKVSLPNNGSPAKEAKNKGVDGLVVPRTRDRSKSPQNKRTEQPSHQQSKSAQDSAQTMKGPAGPTNQPAAAQAKDSAAAEEPSKATGKFTVEQVKARKQAWNKIPLPLVPRKSPQPSEPSNKGTQDGHSRAYSSPVVMASVPAPPPQDSVPTKPPVSAQTSPAKSQQASGSKSTSSTTEEASVPANPTGAEGEKPQTPQTGTSKSKKKKKRAQQAASASASAASPKKEDASSLNRRGG